jgi:hypothetical protein
MKTKTAWIATMVAALFTSVSAQTAGDVALTRAQIQKDRQAIIKSAMNLTEDESRAFWTLYRDYREEMARTGDRLVKLIQDFTTHRETLTDTLATTMIAENFAIQQDELAIRKKHIKRFEKALPARKVARFLQLEQKLDAVVRIELAALIPLTP